MARALIIAAVLMATIFAGGYLTMAVWGWSDFAAGVAVSAVSLSLAVVLIRWAYPPGASRRKNCPHLRPVQALMRKQGVRVTDLSGGGGAYAYCRLDEGALRRVVALPPCLRYSESFDGRESYAALWCDACGVGIQTEHPMDKGGVTFPPA